MVETWVDYEMASVVWEGGSCNIEAVPELLAALKWLVNECKSEGLALGMQAKWEAARDAIAKAEGQ